jgi:thiol-disulfide isomerase/thioredoxin
VLSDIKRKIIFMKNLAICAGLLFLLFACDRNNSNEGTLSATLTNIPNGTVLNFFDLDSGKAFRKIKVYDNKFAIKFNFPTPRAIGIWEDNPKFDKYRLILWLENSRITISGNYDYFVNAKVEGSKSNFIYQQFSSLIRKFDNRLSDLNMSKRTTNIQSVKDSITKEIENVRTQYKDEKMKIYIKYIDSDVALSYLFMEFTYRSSVFSKSDLGKLYDELPDIFKSGRKGKLIKEYVSLPEIPKVGEKFIDFSQLTPEGKPESLSNNLGKYTIIEFWSSGCGPCRAEHPDLIKLYNSYHEKGLSIIGISGDNDPDDWKNAILKDSLPWINISDLRGFNNEAFMLYGIKYIPQMILLDDNGIIVDNDLFSKYLPGELEKRFK